MEIRRGQDDVSGSKSKRKREEDPDTKSNFKSSQITPRYCGICMERKTEQEMFKSTCPSSFCLRCITAHVTAKIRDGIVNVKCPDPTCKVKLELQNCRSFVPRSVVERWEIMICESDMGSKKMYCPFKDCSAVLAVEDRDRGVTSAECPYCHRLFCAQCRVPWHSGLLCSRFDGEIMDQKFLEIAKREKWQRCPNCKFYVERSSGCEHINCRCGYSFCYMCGKNWMSGHLCRPVT